MELTDKLSYSPLLLIPIIIGAIIGINHEDCSTSQIVPICETMQFWGIFFGITMIIGMIVFTLNNISQSKKVENLN